MESVWYAKVNGVFLLVIRFQLLNNSGSVFVLSYYFLMLQMYSVDGSSGLQVDEFSDWTYERSLM